MAAPYGRLFGDEMTREAFNRKNKTAIKRRLAGERTPRCASASANRWPHEPVAFTGYTAEMNALPLHAKARLVVVLNPDAKFLRGRVVTVLRVPSGSAGYDADVQTRDGWELAVNWGQLEPHRKGKET